MTQYDFCDDTFSDLHKDVYGFRPRGIIMENWNMMPDEQKQVRWDELCEELEANDLKMDGKNILPKLHGALLKNEQDVHLFERLAFMARRNNESN